MTQHIRTRTHDPIKEHARDSWPAWLKWLSWMFIFFPIGHGLISDRCRPPRDPPSTPAKAPPGNTTTTLPEEFGSSKGAAAGAVDTR